MLAELPFCLIETSLKTLPGKKKSEPRVPRSLNNP
jgi:hypothetical protein